MSTSFFKNLFHSIRYGIIKTLLIDRFFKIKPNRVRIKPKYSGLMTRYNQPITNVAKAIQRDVVEYHRLLNHATRLIMHNNQLLVEFKEDLEFALSSYSLYGDSKLERDLGLILSQYTPDADNPHRPVPLTTLIRSLTLYGHEFLGYTESPIVVGHARHRHFNQDAKLNKTKAIWVEVERLGTESELNACENLIEGLEKEVCSLVLTLDLGVDIKHPALISLLKQLPQIKERLFFFSPRYEESNSHFCELLEGRLYQLKLAVSYFRELINNNH